MTTKPILPTVREVIGPAKTAIAAARPSTVPHLDHGNWAKPVHGWRGQFAVLNTRLGAEVQAARLALAEGDELTEVAASNFDLQRFAEPRKAIGELVIGRKVVHVRSTAAITAADATDEATAAALLDAIAAAMNGTGGHLRSVYSSATGLGAHRLADTSGTFPSGPYANMGSMVGAANEAKQRFNRHVQNKAVTTGAALAVHSDADTDRLVTTADAFSSAGASPYSANSAASRQSLLVLINALRRAIDAHLALEAPGGVVRAGLRASVAAAPIASPATAATTHVVTADTAVAPGAQTAAIPTVALVAGAGSNLPIVSGQTPTVSLQGSLFDAAATLRFAPTTLRAAGGWAQQSDALLKRSARVGWHGIYGPTAKGMLTGGLRSAGVARYASLEDTDTGTAWIYVTDESWAQSDAWLDEVEQNMRRGWVGLGCKIAMGPVVNRVVRVRLTVVLRDTRYLTDTAPALIAIQAAIRSYLDERQDWWTWRIDALRGVCTTADKLRILQISSVAVVDADGTVLAEPATPPAGNALTHWRFEDNGLEAAFVAAS